MASNKEQMQQAVKEWIEANQKLFKYPEEAYFALVGILEAYGMLD